MKIYKSQSEVEKDIKNNVLAIEGDVKFECNVSIDASIIITNGNINAWNITAGNITAWNINARDINAWNITARDITYWAFCCVYNSIKCLSIKFIRENGHEPICLDGELEIKKPKENLSGKEVEVNIDGKSYKAKLI